MADFVNSSRKCRDLGQPDPAEKNSKISILEKSSGKLHFSLYWLIEEFKVFFSNVLVFPRIGAFPTTRIAKS